MTAKRFTLMSVVNLDYGINDNGKSIGSLSNICDLLNKLNDENEQLKEQLMDCEKFRHTVFQEISKEMNKHD